MDLKYILMNSAGNLYWKDIEGRYRGANQNFTDVMAAQTKDGFIGKTDREISSAFISDKKIAILEETDQRIMRTGVEECLLEEGLDANGKKAFFLTKKIPLRDENAQIVGILGTSLDITKEKQAEIAKNDFISNMEHDLRTPFAGIGGIADLLYSAYSDQYPELKELFEILVNSCAEWQNIHNRIFDALDMQQDIQIERFYIQDELEKTKNMMCSISKIKQIDLIISCPTLEATGQIETDVLKFNLIMSSLIGNAFNFTNDGQITVSVRRTDSSFYIDVIDTGIGIPEDQFDFIFEKFTKLNRSNMYGGTFKGLGMGLYNAKRDAEKIKGEISVKSEVGVGSIFTLTLPITFKSDLTE